MQVYQQKIHRLGVYIVNQSPEVSPCNLYISYLSFWGGGGGNRGVLHGVEVKMSLNFK